MHPQWVELEYDIIQQRTEIKTQYKINAIVWGAPVTTNPAWVIQVDWEDFEPKLLASIANLPFNFVVPESQKAEKAEEEEATNETAE